MQSEAPRRRLRPSRLETLACLIFLISLTVGCATGPMTAGLFTNVTFAGEVNTSARVERTKTAQGCQRTILGIIAWGDAGAGDIALENGITRIAAVDHSTTSLLYILYRDYCTIVYGE